MKVRYTTLLLVSATGSVSVAEITVSAAASLGEALVDIAAKYGKQYPRSKIRLNTAGSSALLQQALRGTPVDALAFTDQETMSQAQVRDVIDKATRKSFVLNSLAIAAPKSSKSTVGRLSGLGDYRSDHIAIGNPANAPVGRYSKTALEKAGIWGNIRSKIVTMQDVRQSSDCVAYDEVDVDFVYNTDAIPMKDGVKVPETMPTQESMFYPVAIAVSGPQKMEVEHFVRCVLSTQGQGALNKYGPKEP